MIISDHWQQLVPHNSYSLIYNLSTVIEYLLLEELPRTTSIQPVIPTLTPPHTHTLHTPLKQLTLAQRPCALW